MLTKREKAKQVERALAGEPQIVRCWTCGDRTPMRQDGKPVCGNCTAQVRWGGRALAMTEREQAEVVERVLSDYLSRVEMVTSANDEHDRCHLNCGHYGYCWRGELVEGDLVKCTCCRVGETSRKIANILMKDR